MRVAESSSELKERLQLEGRWSKFVQRRRELEQQGLSKATAYKRAQEEFGPLQPDGSGAQTQATGAGTDQHVLQASLPASVADSGIVGVPAAEDAGLQPEGELAIDIRRDHLWVYANLHNSSAKESDAPGPGAWAMLLQCRRDAEECSKFYARIGKLLPSRSQIDAEARFSDDGRNVFRTIEKVRRAFKSALLRAGAERADSESEL